jgi:glycosyltransferase involved in cell wall biosynthesis
LPHFSSVVDTVPAKGIVYYCVDEYSSQPNVDAESIIAMEKVVLDRADVAFTVSEVLLEKKRKLNENTYLSTHGVDIDHFRLSANAGLDLPEDIRDVTGPVAGFFGLIEDWIDLALIDHAARALPDVTFIMIGRVVQPTNGLEDLPNVRFLGQRPYAELPGYMRIFDVGMLPYKLNDQVINSNPKKLREYLAGGKAVVSVRVREVERYQDLVAIADDQEQFVHALREAIDNDSPEARQRRISAMENESWQAKVKVIGQRVVEHIPEVHHE